MHIAIFDENVADRKQLERLIQRESHKRISTTGNLFADSFGNINALLASPMQYDAYYIDVCKTEGLTGLDVVNALAEQGVEAPIIMCCSEINYRKLPFPEHVLFLDKPINAAELSESIDHALQIKAQAPSLIELREETQTHYVHEQEILYAVADSIYVFVSLIDGRKIRIASSILNFFSQIENHPVFLAPTNRCIINCRYIAKLGFRSVVMSDGTKFKVHRDCMPYAKEMYAQLNR